MDGLKYQVWYKENILYTGTNPDFKRRHQGSGYAVHVSEGPEGRREGTIGLNKAWGGRGRGIR